MTDVEHAGRCLCGAVRYRATGAPEWIANCHCDSCRRATGAPVTTYAGFPAERFAYVAGEPVRFHSSPGVTRTFCIVNPSETPVAIQGPIDIAPGVGTSTGEFAVTAIRRQTACGTGGMAAQLPQTLATDEVLEVTVTADPANRTGMMQATLTVTSDLAVNPSRSLSLAGNSTSGALTLDPANALVEFGAVDVQGAAAARTI